MSDIRAIERVLVTGATGNVGSEVLRHLRARGVPCVAAVRPRRLQANDPAALRGELHDTEPRAFDLTERDTWARALRGVSELFLVRPPQIANVPRDVAPFLQYVADRGVRRLVFLSVQGAESARVIPHAKIERAIEELEIPHIFVRPSFFMQNLTTTHLPEIRDERRIFVPAGNGSTNFVDVRDLGDAIARLFLDADPGASAFPLTGAASYTYHEVCAALSRILGEEIEYESPGFFRFLRYHRARGRKSRHALVMYMLYSVTRLGKAGGATGDLARILGRSPRSLEEFITDHRDLLLGAS